MRTWATVIVLTVSLLFASQQSGVTSILSQLGSLLSLSETERWNCRPFLPNLHAGSPPSPDHPAVRKATEKLHQYFNDRFAQGDIDSLSVAVVTSNGTLYEGNFGVMRGNETATSAPTNRHSMYRIASVSKLFAVLEGLLLEQKGIISWYDDRVLLLSLTDVVYATFTQE